MKKSIKIIIGICVALIVFVLVFLKIKPFNNLVKNNINLEKVVQPAMNNFVIMTPSWYFFHNDKIFVYDNHGDQLYSANLMAKNKKVIVGSDNLRYADIFMVYENEVYYYTEYNRGIKRLNLSTGKITNVVDNKYLYLIPDTLEKGNVLVNYQNNYLDEAHTYFAKLDLKTGILSDEKTLKFPSEQPYFYSKVNNRIYYIVNEKGLNNIYEDNKIIYSYSADINLSGWRSNPNSNISDIVFVQDGYIFTIISNKIFKFDMTDYSIIELKKLDNCYDLISSVRQAGSRTLGMKDGPAMATTLENPLFSIVDKYSSTDSSIFKGDVYKFNSNNLSFEKKATKDNRGGFVQKYDNYIILQTDIETVIYNEKTNKYKIYDSANYSVEDGYIYLMTYKGDFYDQQSSDLTFKIQKILLDDI